MSLRVSVFGADGMLGSDIVSLSEGRGHSVKAFCFPSFDVCREADIESACKNADMIVNCAAYTAVDKAESEPDICRQVNALSLASIGKAALSRRVKAIHFSTDFVFDGEGSNPWRETDTPAPLSVYGSTKLEGERLLLESGCDCLILRIQWTYGRHGRHFISKILETAETNKDFSVVDDQVGSPTHTMDVARAALDLADIGASGLFHFAASGYASRCEVAQAIVAAADAGARVSPRKSSSFHTPAKRPLNSRLDCSKVDAILPWQRPHWKDSLDSYLRV